MHSSAHTVSNDSSYLSLSSNEIHWTLSGVTTENLAAHPLNTFTFHSKMLNKPIAVSMRAEEDGMRVSFSMEAGDLISAVFKLGISKLAGKMSPQSAWRSGEQKTSDIQQEETAGPTFLDLKSDDYYYELPTKNSILGLNNSYKYNEILCTKAQLLEIANTSPNNEIHMKLNFRQLTTFSLRSLFPATAEVQHASVIWRVQKFSPLKIKDAYSPYFVLGGNNLWLKLDYGPYPRATSKDDKQKPRTMGAFVCAEKGSPFSVYYTVGIAKPGSYDKPHMTSNWDDRNAINRKDNSVVNNNPKLIIDYSNYHKTNSLCETKFDTEWAWGFGNSYVVDSQLLKEKTITVRADIFLIPPKSTIPTKGTAEYKAYIAEQAKAELLKRKQEKLAKELIEQNKLQEIAEAEKKAEAQRKAEADRLERQAKQRELKAARKAQELLIAEKESRTVSIQNLLKRNVAEFAPAEEILAAQKKVWEKVQADLTIVKLQAAEEKLNLSRRKMLDAHRQHLMTLSALVSEINKIKNRYADLSAAFSAKSNDYFAKITQAETLMQLETGVDPELNKDKDDLVKLQNELHDQMECLQELRAKVERSPEPDFLPPKDVLYDADGRTVEYAGREEIFRMLIAQGYVDMANEMKEEVVNRAVSFAKESSVSSSSRGFWHEKNTRTRNQKSAPSTSSHVPASVHLEPIKPAVEEFKPKSSATTAIGRGTIVAIESNMNLLKKQAEELWKMQGSFFSVPIMPDQKSSPVTSDSHNTLKVTKS